MSTMNNNQISQINSEYSSSADIVGEEERNRIIFKNASYVGSLLGELNNPQPLGAGPTFQMSDINDHEYVDSEWAAFSWRVAQFRGRCFGLAVQFLAGLSEDLRDVVLDQAEALCGGLGHSILNRIKAFVASGVCPFENEHQCPSGNCSWCDSWEPEDDNHWEYGWLNGDRVAARTVRQIIWAGGSLATTEEIASWGPSDPVQEI